MKIIHNLKFSLIGIVAGALLGSMSASAFAQGANNYDKDGLADWDWGESDEAACWGDTLSVFEDEIVAQIMQQSPSSKRKTWRSYFLKSYLDGHTVQPSNYTQIDQWDYDGPQGKWMIAAFLVEYGINSSEMPVNSPNEISLISRPWHGKYDYRRNAKARGTKAHYKYGPRYSKDTPDGGVLGKHNWHKYLGGHTEKVTLFCPIFEKGNYFAHPMLRASVQVHEGQHSREYRYQDHDDYGHKTCTTKNLDGSTLTFDCDKAVLHSRYAYTHGAMYKSNEKPYQTGYEFACDISEHPNSWVPSDVRIRAMLEAEFGRKRIQNEALPACGNPYPFGRKTAEKPTCPAGKTCECPAGLAMCGTACVDLSSSNGNCGACGNTCAGSCVAGACQVCNYGSCSNVSDCNGYLSCTNGCCAEPIPQ